MNLCWNKKNIFIEPVGAFPRARYLKRAAKGLHASFAKFKKIEVDIALTVAIFFFYKSYIHIVVTRLKIIIVKLIYAIRVYSWKPTIQSFIQIIFLIKPNNILLSPNLFDQINFLMIWFSWWNCIELELRKIKIKNFNYN